MVVTRVEKYTTVHKKAGDLELNLPLFNIKDSMIIRNPLCET